MVVSVKSKVSAPSSSTLSSSSAPLLNLPTDEIIRLVMGFLSDGFYAKALRGLEEESDGIMLEVFEPELGHLRDLIMDGEWREAIAFIEPFRSVKFFDFQSVLFEVHKGRLLEILSLKPSENALRVCGKDRFDPEVIASELKVLEKCAGSNRTEFNLLCSLLTLPSVNDHPNYVNFTVNAGRFECFERIKNQFKTIFPGNQEFEKKRKVAKGRLVDLVVKGLLYEGSVACRHKQTPRSVAKSLGNVNILQAHPSSMEYVDLIGKCGKDGIYVEKGKSVNCMVKGILLRKAKGEDCEVNVWMKNSFDDLADSFSSADEIYSAKSDVMDVNMEDMSSPVSLEGKPKPKKKKKGIEKNSYGDELKSSPVDLHQSKSMTGNGEDCGDINTLGKDDKGLKKKSKAEDVNTPDKKDGQEKCVSKEVTGRIKEQPAVEDKKNTQIEIVQESTEDEKEAVEQAASEKRNESEIRDIALLKTTLPSGRVDTNHVPSKDEITFKTGGTLECSEHACESELQDQPCVESAEEADEGDGRHSSEKKDNGDGRPERSQGNDDNRGCSKLCGEEESVLEHSAETNGNEKGQKNSDNIYGTKNTSEVNEVDASPESPSKNGSESSSITEDGSGITLKDEGEVSDKSKSSIQMEAGIGFIKDCNELIHQVGQEKSPIPDNPSYHSFATLEDIQAIRAVSFHPTRPLFAVGFQTQEHCAFAL